MNKRTMNGQMIEEFGSYLENEEKSPATLEKYLRDVRAFWHFAGEQHVTRELVRRWKDFLVERKYAVRSVNSMLASVNSFLQFLGWENCKVKSLKLQRKIYCPEEKELTKSEYLRLLKAAQDRPQLKLVMETICGTGIRVSELQYFTVEHVKSGQIFLTKHGKPLNRSNIWAQMKRLCKTAGVAASKVFPHNLRKLFARSFYRIERDIAKLADVLGHSNINTTRIYIISTGTEHRRHLERLGLVI